MTVIAGASASVRGLADGTLRISIDFEPRHAKQAYELFGAPGTAVACAALKDGFEAVPDKPQSPPMGPICREAVNLCKLEEFWDWCGGADEAEARNFILATCRVDSRKELDTEPAKSKFIQEIRIPFIADRRKAA